MAQRGRSPIRLQQAGAQCPNVKTTRLDCPTTPHIGKPGKHGSRSSLSTSIDNGPGGRSWSALRETPVECRSTLNVRAESKDWGFAKRSNSLQLRRCRRIPDLNPSQCEFPRAQRVRQTPILGNLGNSGAICYAQFSKPGRGRNPLPYSIHGILIAKEQSRRAFRGEPAKGPIEGKASFSIVADRGPEKPIRNDLRRSTAVSSCPGDRQGRTVDDPQPNGHQDADLEARGISQSSRVRAVFGTHHERSFGNNRGAFR